MPVLLLFGLLNIMLAVFFWSKEIQPWIENLYTPKYITAKYWEIFNIFIRLYASCVNIYRIFTHGKFLLIDLAITAFMVSMLGFGDAVSGGVLGLAMSNCVSLLIIKVMKDRAKLNLKT